MPRSFFLKCAAVVLASLAVTIAAACGDSDDEGDARKAATEQAAEAPRSTETTPRPPDEQAGKPDRRDGQGADSADGDGGQSASPSRGGSTAANPEARRVEAAVKGMYTALARGDAAGVCDAMSRKVRDQIARGVPSSTEPADERTCVESFSQFISAPAASGVLGAALRATVADPRVDGDSASAAVTLDGRTGRITLVKEDGEWRFGQAPTATGAP